MAKLAKWSDTAEKREFCAEHVRVHGNFSCHRAQNRALTDRRRDLISAFTYIHGEPFRRQPRLPALPSALSTGNCFHPCPPASRAHFIPLTPVAHLSPSSRPQPPDPSAACDFAKQSSLYQEFLAEREEILRHKWIESERLGQDIGFERALLDWIRKHREGWRSARRSGHSTPPIPLKNSGSNGANA